VSGRDRLKRRGQRPSVHRLRDGAALEIRPIEPRDKDGLAEGFAQLSPESRYRRFLSPMDHLTSSSLAYLTEVDHHDHEALVAVDAQSGEPAGVGRFIRIDGEPTIAEVAVAVPDAWQGRGVGSELLARLADRAGEEGVATFRATCLSDNVEALHLLESLGPERPVGSGAGVIELEVDLNEPLRPESPLRRALREAAAGMLAFANPRRGT
jgi:RimJ/RimL family protein N-acetyltransferase